MPSAWGCWDEGLEISGLGRWQPEVWAADGALCRAWTAVAAVGDHGVLRATSTSRSRDQSARCSACSKEEESCRSARRSPCALTSRSGSSATAGRAGAASVRHPRGIPAAVDQIRLRALLGPPTHGRDAVPLAAVRRLALRRGCPGQAAVGLDGGGRRDPGASGARDRSARGADPPQPGREAGAAAPRADPRGRRGRGQDPLAQAGHIRLRRLSGSSAEPPAAEKTSVSAPAGSPARSLHRRSASPPPAARRAGRASSSAAPRAASRSPGGSGRTARTDRWEARGNPCQSATAARHPAPLAYPTTPGHSTWVRWFR